MFVEEGAIGEYGEEFQAEPEVTPVFSLRAVEFNPGGKIKHMVVCSDILVMALGNNQITRLDLGQPSKIQDISISKGDDQIHKLFMDPSGHHLIISMTNEDNYYIFLNWQKPKLLSKLRGIKIESVAWNKNGDATSTKQILIGTSKGKIYETVIESNEKAFMERLVSGGGKDQTFQQVYTLNENMPITGLRFEAFPTENSKYFVMAATPTRVYQFIGGPTFEQLFAKYETNAGFLELPGDLDHSDLAFFSKYSQGLPQSFAWLTGPGVYYGDLIFGSQNTGESVMVDHSLVPYPSFPGSEMATTVVDGRNRMLSIPLSLILTQYHFVLLYYDRIQAISSITREVVWEEQFGKRIRNIRGMAYDQNGKAMRTAWLYTETQVYEIYIDSEDRNVWEMYLSRNLFDAAYQHCKNDRQMDKVLTSQAEHNFKNKEYKVAAACYGKTKKSFEEIALKFYSINEQSALRNYLSHKLKSIKQNENATQCTLIATWLTEIYLDKLNECSSNNSGPQQQKEIMQNQEVMEEEFEKFLQENEKYLDQSTTYNLIASHGRIKELLFYATLKKDHERVIQYHIQNGDYKKALGVLQEGGTPKMYYEFSPIFMHHIPYYTVNLWIKNHQQLEPRKLLPSIMRYNHASNIEDGQVNQAIRYLEFCVKRCQNEDMAIHDYLLSLYVQQRSEKELIAFIEQRDKFFDIKNALRLCLKENKTKPCVLLYSAMGQYEEAVDLALEVDLNLAKENANKPEEDEGLRKKLWLKIARFVVEQKKDIQGAMELLNECDLLKIEDILPFFPDFTRIDQFKNEICSSLEDYNRHIDQLKTEMEEATRSADLIRKDIKDIRNKYGFIGVSENCSLCKTPALAREFYLFPCAHAFHEDCLKTKMMKGIGSVDIKRLTKLTEELGHLQRDEFKEVTDYNPTENREDRENSAMYSKMEKIKEEIDNLVAAECPFCGQMMIQSITEPFVTANDLEALTWQI
ncbi:hypothetical protein PROFUN_09752 [Planoprotostelium fungivorum]|uniref:RING-type domain-containing protein n=1 Tax=Planoprotostelium fungivorum TaxID=1890364 RepID=A0A2P6NFD3_9EUKA|nr:hypothetical protein PROFUN_09752 [Planoprotostelium fungivorum]